jgi:hypothetical protein
MFLQDTKHSHFLCPSFRRLLSGMAVFSVMLAFSVSVGAEKPESEKKADDAKSEASCEKAEASDQKEEKTKKDPYAWQPLFDGKSLDNWVVPVYGGDGLVNVKKGGIVIGMGESVTGIRYTGEFPRMNYEIRYEARRTMGTDFFATLTFPVGNESFCSFVNGGWGGTIVGISCVDHYDASDNQTTTNLFFKDNIWYKFRIRVSEKKIEAWVNDEKVVDLITENHIISTRSEVDLYRPLGFTTWCTEGEIRKIEVRKLRPKEIQKIEKEVAEYQAVYTPFGEASQ